MNQHSKKGSSPPFRESEGSTGPPPNLYRKVMPQAIQIEQVVIGAAILDKNAYPNISEKLRPESFYLQAHGAIYEAMTQLFENSKPIDILTIQNQLSKNNKLEEIGGLNYLMELSNMVSSSANIEYHAHIILQKYIQRQLIQISTLTINEAYAGDMDVLEMLDATEQALYDITDQNMNTGFLPVSNIAAGVATKLEKLSQQPEALTGVPTGFSHLDKMTNGWQKSDLIIIAARPGMGKTAFSLSLAYNAAANGRPVGIFSLEMNNDQLVERLLSMDSMIPATSIKQARLSAEEWPVLAASVAKISSLPLYIDDTPAINIFELRAKCRRLKQHHGISMIVIDYLQLMRGVDKKGSNREQEISSISRSLKAMAKELEIPVIALSQLSRAVETRGGDKRPILSDLRESGAIEQDADIVTFIYRPEYYGINDDEDDDTSSEIILKKNRHGAVGTTKLKFLKEYVKFTENINAGFQNMNDQRTTPEEEDVFWG